MDISRCRIIQQSCQIQAEPTTTRQRLLIEGSALIRHNYQLYSEKQVISYLGAKTRGNTQENIVNIRASDSIERIRTGEISRAIEPLDRLIRRQKEMFTKKTTPLMQPSGHLFRLMN